MRRKKRMTMKTIMYLMKKKTRRKQRPKKMEVKLKKKKETNKKKNQRLIRKWALQKRVERRPRGRFS